MRTGIGLVSAVVVLASLGNARADTRPVPRLSCLTITCGSGKHCETIKGKAQCVANKMCNKACMTGFGCDPNTGRCVKSSPSPLSAAWKVWRTAMLRTPLPARGCFTASHPNKSWQKVPCTTPRIPRVPASKRPEMVGGGIAFAAQSSGSISATTGSFDSVTGVTSETGLNGANGFSLQLNTNPFPTKIGGCDTIPGCKGWQQFVYTNSGSAFGEGTFYYILLGYGPKCPPGWTGGGDCTTGGTYAFTLNPGLAITDLGKVSLTATASATGGDTIVLTTPDGILHGANNDSVLQLAGAWHASEFNIFGEGGFDQAIFNGPGPNSPGSTLVVRIAIDDGTTNAPTCQGGGWTGESNNLTLVPGSCCTIGGPSPAIVFTESNATNPVAATCPLPVASTCTTKAITDPSVGVVQTATGEGCSLTRLATSTDGNYGSPACEHQFIFELTNARGRGNGVTVAPAASVYPQDQATCTKTTVTLSLFGHNASGWALIGTTTAQGKWLGTAGLQHGCDFSAAQLLYPAGYNALRAVGSASQPSRWKNKPKFIPVTLRVAGKPC
jgi:hypothetical protein